MNSADLHQIDRRRAILSCLVVAPANRMPRAGLREQLQLAGYTATLEELAEDLAWLHAQGLVDWSKDVASLTESGTEISLNRRSLPRADPFQAAATELRRGLLLRLLAQSPERSASLHLLAAAMPGFQQTASMRALKADLAWLAARGLATQGESAGVTFAALTDDGLDVAEDRAQAQGVARARPGN